MAKPSRSYSYAEFSYIGYVSDRRLKRFIQDAKLNNLIGSLMTDVSKIIETNSGNVSVNAMAATETLMRKIVSTEKSQNRHIIYLGEKSI